MARRLSIRRNELNLKMMLEGGQCFRWKKTGCSEWTGIMQKLLWKIRQFENHIEYEVYGNKSSLKSVKETMKKQGQEESNVLDTVLENYLRLHDDINKLYDSWTDKDVNFKNVASAFSGIRILNQDPIENLFSFICSSNNNIKRISSMVEKLCEIYGKPVIELNGIKYSSFPEVSALTEPSVEAELRKAGFGYRAKYIYQSANLLQNLGGREFLNRLKDESYETAKLHLMKFPGVGAKVADCVCLMSLGHLQAVPVDTHVFQIASGIYLPHLRKAKTVTNRVYDEIGDHFRELYGPLAGWAHAILFCADLKMFCNVKNKPKTPISVKRKLPSSNHNLGSD